jgi:hypothetical protein
MPPPGSVQRIQVLPQYNRVTFGVGIERLVGRPGFDPDCPRVIQGDARARRAEQLQSRELSWLT